MSTATITLTKVDTALPAGNTAFASTHVTLTDSAGAVQTLDVNGSESPQWVAVFSNVSDTTGASGTVTAQDLDASGNPIGAAVSTTYSDAATGGGGGGTFPATTAITVSVA